MQINQTRHEELKDLYEKHPKQITNILNSSLVKCKSGQHEKAKQKFKLLCQWIYDITSFLDRYQCSLQQRIHWILNKLENFPRCKICGKLICDPKRFKNIQVGYSDFCSSKCARKYGSLLSKETRFSKNNGKYFSEKSIQKQKQSFIKHYGVDNNMKCEKGRKTHDDAIEKKYGKGIRNIFQLPEKIQKLEQTKQSKYGNKHWNNRDKARKTFKDRSDDDKQKQRKSFKEKSLSHFGVDHPMKNPNVCAKAQQNRKQIRYHIDGFFFDSKPEFCFYVCCRDFKIGIQCHPIDKTLIYFDKLGKKHQYFPDFFIPSIGKIVEIKGDQFFKDHNESCDLIDLYRKDGISGKNEAKCKCMKENNVLIISTSRYALYERRVKRKYGNAWIKQHKVSSKKKIKNAFAHELSK